MSYLSNIIFSTFLAAMGLMIIGTGAITAQETQPSIKFNLFEVGEFVISDSYTIGKSFSAEHGVPILVPFQIQVPRQDNVTPLFEIGTAPGGMIVKIYFTTGHDDTPMDERQSIENLQFIPMTLPMDDDLDARMQNLTTLLINEAFPQVTKNLEDVEYIGARRTQIGDIDAIDAVGKHIHADLGTIYVRITGYVNPHGVDAIYSVVNAVASRYDISNLDQLFLTGSGKTIDSFKFIQE